MCGETLFGQSVGIKKTIDLKSELLVKIFFLNKGKYVVEVGNKFYHFFTNQSTIKMNGF